MTIFLGRRRWNMYKNGHPSKRDNLHILCFYNLHKKKFKYFYPFLRSFCKKIKYVWARRLVIQAKANLLLKDY